MIKSFPANKIEQIIERLSYKDLKPLFKGLDKCAKVILSLQLQNPLYLMQMEEVFSKMNSAIKKTQSTTPTKVDLGKKPTKHQITQVDNELDKQIKVYHLYQIVTETLKKLIT